MPKLLKGGWIDVSDCDVHLYTDEDIGIKTGVNAGIVVNGIGHSDLKIQEAKWRINGNSKHGNILIKTGWDRRIALKMIKEGFKKLDKNNIKQDINLVGSNIRVISDNTPRGTRIFILRKEWNKVEKRWDTSDEIEISALRLYVHIGDANTLISYSLEIL